MRLLKLTALCITLALAGTAAHAQKGPVAAACKDDIAAHCAGMQHGQGGVRACLEANKTKVSEACKAALDSTGPGKGMGQGKGQGQP